MPSLRRPFSLAVALLLPAGAGRAGLTATLAPDATPGVVGRIFHVNFVVVNAGPAAVVFAEGGNPGSFGASPGLGDLGTMFNFSSDGSQAFTLQPGQAHTFSAAVRPKAPGVWTFSANVSARNTSGAPATVSVSTSVSVTVVTVAAIEAVHPVASGSMEIRHNVVRVRNTRNQASAERALILIRGTPGQEVTLDVMGPTGMILGAVEPDPNQSGGSTGGRVVIGADGIGAATFNGLAGNEPLSTGLYWIVSSGAVTGRKPVLVISDAN